MSDDQAHYYHHPTIGPPFFILTPEPAPLGSFQNPYPANSFPLTSLPPSTSTSTSTTPSRYAPASAPLYGSAGLGQTQTHIHTAEFPVQYLQPTPLLCGCDAVSGTQQGATPPKQDHADISSIWWPAPPMSTPSASPQQQTVMACTGCGQVVDFHTAAPCPAVSTINPPVSCPAAQPQAPPAPRPNTLRSTNQNYDASHLTRSTASAPRPPSASTTGPIHPPPAAQILNRISDPHLEPDFDFASQYEVRKWPHCHVCNEKPALREKERVLFCEGCWSEAARAETEREWGDLAR